MCLTSSHVLRWADAYKNAQCMTLIANAFKNGYKSTFDSLKLLKYHQNSCSSKLAKKSDK